LLTFWPDPRGYMLVELFFHLFLLFCVLLRLIFCYDPCFPFNPSCADHVFCPSLRVSSPNFFTLNFSVVRPFRDAFSNPNPSASCLGLLSRNRATEFSRFFGHFFFSSHSLAPSGLPSFRFSFHPLFFHPPKITTLSLRT